MPRPLFSKRGLKSFHATAPAARAALLRDLSAPSYPPGREWDEPLERAMATSQFRVSDTSLTNGWAEQVICATGFLRGWRHDMVLSDLVAAHSLVARKVTPAMEHDTPPYRALYYRSNPSR